MAKKKTYIIQQCDKYLAMVPGRGVSVGEIWDAGWRKGLAELEHKIKCLPIFGDPSLNRKDHNAGKVLLAEVLEEIRNLMTGD